MKAVLLPQQQMTKVVFFSFFLFLSFCLPKQTKTKLNQPNIGKGSSFGSILRRFGSDLQSLQSSGLLLLLLQLWLWLGGHYNCSFC